MILISLSTIGVIFFLVKHFATLIKELKNYAKFKKTEEFKELKNSNAEVTLMTIPLTLAMSMNVAFIATVLFIPGLWNVIEYIFPVALAMFVLIGVYGLKIYGEYFARIMTK
jgi:hypothetical protein